MSATRIEVGRRWLSAGRFLMAAISLSGVIAIWQITMWTGLLDPRFFAAPTDVVVSGWELIRDASFWAQLGGSARAFLIGYILAAITGVTGGLIIGWNSTLRQLFVPPIMALYATPRLALLPVIVIWLGIGTGSTVAVVYIGAVIPMVVNSMVGMTEADPNLVRAARVFLASKLQLLTKVYLPGSLPSIVTGLRLGVGRGVLGVVVAEMYVSTEGIGHLIRLYGTSFRTAHLVFLVLFVALFGYGISSLISQAERRVAPWRSGA